MFLKFSAHNGTQEKFVNKNEMLSKFNLQMAAGKIPPNLVELKLNAVRLCMLSIFDGKLPVIVLLAMLRYIRVDKLNSADGKVLLKELS